LAASFRSGGKSVTAIDSNPRFALPPDMHGTANRAFRLGRDVGERGETSRDDFPGNGPFNLLCNNAEKRVFFTFVHEEGTQLGRSPSVELSAGAAKASLTGIISPPDETGHTFFESRVVGVRPVLAVLQTSRTLTVKLGAKSTTLPDKGRVAAADQFAKACKVE
jgi:hypothetical protein